MSPLYLYAVLAAAPAADAGAGMTGEPLRLLACGDLVAVAGEVAAAPAIAPETLRAHDAVVRRLADAVDAVLPARFGMMARDEASLCAHLERASGALRDALARVARCEQMILRVFREAPDTPSAGAAAPDTPPRGTGASDPRGGEAPGTRYLAERVAARHAATQVPEIDALRPVLDGFVTAERIERHDASPLVASLYHLVPRGQAAAYTAVVQDAARGLRGLRIAVSGPWAPYAFAPDALE